MICKLHKAAPSFALRNEHNLSAVEKKRLMDRKVNIF
jgi:hypothetical protein